MNQLLEAALLGVKQLEQRELKLVYQFIRQLQPNKEAQNRVDELAWNSGMICVIGEAHEGPSECLKRFISDKVVSAAENEDE